MKATQQAKVARQEGKNPNHHHHPKHYHHHHRHHKGVVNRLSPAMEIGAGALATARTPGRGSQRGSSLGARSLAATKGGQGAARAALTRRHP
jgi:hypothetical protein